MGSLASLPAGRAACWRRAPFLLRERRSSARSCGAPLTTTRCWWKGAGAWGDGACGGTLAHRSPPSSEALFQKGEDLSRGARVVVSVDCAEHLPNASGSL